MPITRTIVTVTGTSAYIAEVRYRMAVRLQVLVVAGRLYGDTWIVRAQY